MKQKNNSIYLERGQIDIEKWDNCIARAYKGLPYAFSWYLDVVATNWGGMVWGDYEVILPLIWKKKAGIHYLYQPFFTQQLGFFSRNPVTNSKKHQLLEAIPQKFLYIDIQANPSSFCEYKGFCFSEKPNYILPLNKPYEKLYASFSQNIKRSIKRAARHQPEWIENVTPETTISIYKEFVAQRTPELKANDYTNLLRLMEVSKQKGIGKNYGLKVGEAWGTVGFFLFSHHRIINLFPATTQVGRQAGTSAFLLNKLIETHSDSQQILDFEGSAIPGIAHFYRKFGAVQENYWGIRCNRLPHWLKWLKP